MAAKYIQIPGSFREAPAQANSIASAKAVNPTDKIEVSIYLKDRDADPMLRQGPMSVAQAQSANRSQTPRDTTNGSGDLNTVTKFAADAGLSVVRTDPARRLVKVAGTVAQLEAAFRTKLQYYHDGKQAFRARAGSLSAPEDVVNSIDAVLGLDTRPIAKPKLQRTLNPHTIVGHLPNEVGRLYDFPVTAKHGGGQCIAIIELGGGYRDEDHRKAFAAMGLAPPTVASISVSGGLNQPGVDQNSDGEVALDVQVAGGVAPGAKIAIYFAPNTTQGFVDAITRAANDEQNRPSVISISWGSAESNWTGQGLTVMNTAMRDAARKGVTVFAASGDDLATDGEQDGRAHVDFPASSPYAVGCGGTLINTANSKIMSERIWNYGGQGTGGGVSDKFDLPAYQSSAHVPPSYNDHVVRRGVPDVTASGDPRSGYRVVVGGGSGDIGGTSAVAPLFAGLFALINEAAGKPSGFIHPLIYGNANAFRQITLGDNKNQGIGYAAGAGWNACAGLGAPNGAKLADVFMRAAGVSGGTKKKKKRPPAKKSRKRAGHRKTPRAR